MNILIVDDNPADREILRYYLEKHGCTVAEAADGVKGLEMAALCEPDLIISDALMPNLDGFQFLRKIKADPVLRHIPFIFYSSVFTGQKDEELAKSLGAEAFLVKPKAPEELWSEICAAQKRRVPESGLFQAVPVDEEEEYLRSYGNVVTAKIEEQIAELERANTEIRQQAGSYRNLFNSIRDVIVVMDYDRTIVNANQPAMRDLFGYELEEVLGRETRLLYPDEGSYLATELLDRSEFVNGKIIREVKFRKKDGGVFVGEMCALQQLDEDGVSAVRIAMIRDITARKEAEEALRRSEERRIHLQAELKLAAEIQAKLLPRYFPAIPGFEIVARCLPAHEVGGDFYDWQEVGPATFSLTLGDVMGNGMAAAMLMATVRAAIRAESQVNDPATAVQMAERALRSDLESSESFVTLFHARLDVSRRTLRYVDCGHGLVFLRRADGTIEELQVRGLPLGVSNDEIYQDGVVTFDRGDTLVLYSDGLIEAWPAPGFDNRILAGQLGGGGNAIAMMERLARIPQHGAPPDDLTMLLVRCTGEGENP